ncbi:MAG: response regulator, partial [Proteobacteria bacterium]|nr:response regulator [Pseudomonadota bacterium]MBU1639039.1 response regulator [Pseudomonadota bacterium]
MAIIVGGFSLVMLQGAWVGHYIQNQNLLVTEHFFPAALHGQDIISAYMAQLEEFEEAILTAEPERLKTAAGHTKNIINGLENIIAMTELPPALITLAKENLDHYRNFESQAFPLYAHMLTDPADDSLLAAAAEMHRLSQDLSAAFTLLTKTISTVVSDELQSITALTQRQNKNNLLIFLVVIVISSLLVAYILSHSIIRPLKKTVALANMMADGDLSQKLDIKQNDEIGELAQAMNAMARTLEDHYQELEDTVHEKTITLQKANSQLVLEIGQRKDTQHELLSAMAEVEKANRTKSTFLSMMSHELRTPMNGIIGMSSLALDTALTTTQNKYLSTIKNSAESLLTILNDILDFSTIEAQKLELESVDFEPRKIMDDISERLSLRAHDMGLDFFTLTDPTIPDWLHGDGARLRQVLLNLTGNAIKFTKSGEVAMRMEVIDRSAHAVTIRFAVSDTGIGIPKDRLVNLFEPFAQADVSTTRKFGGTGLGLSISNRLVELMGGKIQVESAEGEGSTFWFTATFTISDHARQAGHATGDRSLIYREGKIPPQGPPFKAPDKRILAVDDDNTNLVVAQAILETFGCVVDLARTGQEALDRLLEADYDLILMDIQMPVLDGLEATAAIKGWAKSPDAKKQAKSRTPIIALTADISAGARTKYLAAGMVDYLGKPLRPDILASSLKKWLHTTQGEEKSQAQTIHFSQSRLLQRLGGDQQKLKELTLATRIAIPQYLAELKTACANNNCQQAAATCLEIKKMGAKLGLAPLQHYALHLTMAMENNAMDQSRDHYQHLRTLLTELLKTLDDS